jgi:hypothetical protein
MSRQGGWLSRALLWALAACASTSGELVVTARDSEGQEIFNGGALRAFFTVGRAGPAHNAGLHGCLLLRKQLARLGLDEHATLSLRWVRTEGIHWPCHPARTQCLAFTGPLARLEAR